MKIKSKEAAKCLLLAGGNIGEGLVRYISENGCDGFNCKGCVLKLVCEKRPADAKAIASRVLYEVMSRKKMIQKV